MKKMFLAVLGAALFVFSGCNNLEVSSEKVLVQDEKLFLKILKKLDLTNFLKKKFSSRLMHF